jgi:hypothetical protein
MEKNDRNPITKRGGDGESSAFDIGLCELILAIEYWRALN